MTSNDDALSKELSVSVTRPGPLLLRMRLDVSGMHAVVMGFERSVDGAKGQLEEDGRVEENDILEDINGISLKGRTLEDILLQISRVSRDCHVRTLRFRKPWGKSLDARLRAQEGGVSASGVKAASAAAADDDNDGDDDEAAGISSSLQLDALPNPLPSAVGTNEASKAQPFLALLKETLINEGRLRNLASQGIPEKHGLRGVIWRLLLKYLPLETDLWAERLMEHRQEYANTTERLIQSTPYTSYFPNSSTSTSSLDIMSGGTTLKPGVLVKVDDDPLRISDASAWATYFADVTLMEEIQKDVVRTHPDINFFNTDPIGAHQSIMQRILFIYAKVHPSVRYVQGMNELCGTLYYVFASDENEEFANHAEADTYHCFCRLVHEMQDVFIRQKDSSDSGIIARIKEFTDLLQCHDPELHSLLETQGIDAAFYGLRWLTTILSREFNLPDTIRLWDTLFSDTNRNELLSYICCTMIREQRSKLLLGDFSENLGLLQSYPETDVNSLLTKAVRLRSKDFSRRMRILSGNGDTSIGREDLDTPQMRFLASLKSVAGAAGTSLSDMKSSVGIRLQGVRTLITEGNTLLRASRDSLGERVGSVRNWFAVTRQGGTDGEDLTPF